MTKLSRDERFKIWRSKQSHFMNSIITLLMFLWDMLWFLIFGIVAIAIIAIILMVMVQAMGNAYSGH